MTHHFKNKSHYYNGMGIVSPISISKLFGKNEIFFDDCKALLSEQYEDYSSLLKIPFNILSTMRNIHRTGN